MEKVELSQVAGSKYTTMPCTKLVTPAQVFFFFFSTQGEVLLLAGTHHLNRTFLHINGRFSFLKHSFHPSGYICPKEALVTCSLEGLFYLKRMEVMYRFFPWKRKRQKKTGSLMVIIKMEI